MTKVQFGWAGEVEATRAWDAIGHRFPEFQVFGTTEFKRTTAWDCFTELGLSLDWFENQRQEIGDCFAAGTAIYGDVVKAVEDVKVGDVVFDGNLNKTKVITTKKKVSYNPLITFHLSGSQSLSVTGDHLVLVDREGVQQDSPEGWKENSAMAAVGVLTKTPKWHAAAGVRVGDRLVLPKGDRRVREILAIDVQEGPHTVYDIGVESPQHSVIANGVVAHNCVSWGAANAIMGTMAYEIVRLGDAEEFKRVFQPYLYAIGRLTPEGGNGRLGNQDGSLGSWQAAAVEKYGVLRSDFQGVPAYSGRVAKQWGTQRNGPWRQFIDEADNHLIKASARIRNADELKQAICNGYFCSIASNKGWSMRLRDSQGKSWFQGRDTWPHQMAIMAFDVQPMDCFYMKNQWGINAHGPQLDGPQGGGWRTADEIDSDLRNPGTECFAFSQFNGFPSNEEKPRNLYV